MTVAPPRKGIAQACLRLVADGNWHASAGGPDHAVGLVVHRDHIAAYNLAKFFLISVTARVQIAG